MKSNLSQYTIYKDEIYKEIELRGIEYFCKENGLIGTEVFMDDILSRDKILFSNTEEKEDVIKKLNRLNVKRLHCSYWAYPTSFLCKNNFNELVERFGGLKDVEKYYGDLTGTHMFDRWVQEYEVACDIKAQAYTFHLIDYAPIDGKWDFTISKEDIRQAMVFMAQHFINLLMERNLISENSPQIELENAGWGLEHGIQNAADYKMLFDQIYDPFNKLKIAWDINHLLHAVGYVKEEKGAFLLPDNEINLAMKEIEKNYGDTPEIFVHKWLEHNILDPELIKHIGSLHLSDCILKDMEYFKNGKLKDEFHRQLSELSTWDEQENYGVNIVLTSYDSHVVLGDGILNPRLIKEMIKDLLDKNPDVVLLHELKNSLNQEEAVKVQLDRLSLC